MRINADLVIKARKRRPGRRKNWRPRLGLNLRTVQRIESDAAASLQSKKALASALDLDIHDLESQEIAMPQQWDYRVIETKDRANLQPELAHLGNEGWELVSATAMFNTMMTKVIYTLFFKRPRA